MILYGSLWIRLEVVSLGGCSHSRIAKSLHESWTVNQTWLIRFQPPLDSWKSKYHQTGIHGVRSLGISIPQKKKWVEVLQKGNLTIPSGFQDHIYFIRIQDGFIVYDSPLDFKDCQGFKTWGLWEIPCFRCFRSLCFKYPSISWSHGRSRDKCRAGYSRQNVSDVSTVLVPPSTNLQMVLLPGILNNQFVSWMEMCQGLNSHVMFHLFVLSLFCIYTTRVLYAVWWVVTPHQWLGHNFAKSVRNLAV